MGEGVENESEGWGREWRMRARDGGVENESEGWGREWRMRVRDGGGSGE